MLPDIQPGNTKILYFFNCLLDGMHTNLFGEGIFCYLLGVAKLYNVLGGVTSIIIALGHPKVCIKF